MVSWKRLGGMASVLCLLSVSIPIVAGADSPAPGWTLAGELPVGTGAGKVPYDFGEGEPQGPDSFAVDSQGTIFILDSLERSIEILHEGRYLGTIDLSFTTEPGDLVVGSDDTLYVLDRGTDPLVVYQLEVNGKIIASYPLKGALGAVSGLTLDAEERLWIRIEGTQQIALTKAIRGQSTPMSGQTPAGGIRATQMKRSEQGIQVDDGKRSLTVLFQGAFGAVTVLGQDAAGHLHIEALDMVDGPVARGELTLRKYDRTGKQVGVVLMNPPDWAYVPKTRITALGLDGNAYALLPLGDRVQVVKAAYAPTYTSRFHELQAQADAEAASGHFVDDSQPNPIGVMVTDTQSQANSFSIVSHSWTFGSANRTPDNSTTAPPDWLKNAPTGSKTAIPYNWGGFDSPWTSSAPSSWTDYDDAMSNDKWAGNVKTQGNYKANTAGLDCSGFVSAVWELSSKVGTYAIKDSRSLTEVITRSNLLVMDAAVNADHVVLKKGEDTGGLSTAEATLTGNDKAQHGYRTWTYLTQNNYVFRKYTGMCHSTPCNL